MKKLFVLFAAIIAGALFGTDSFAQIAYSGSVDSYLQEYQLGQTYQGKEMSKEEEEKLLKSLTPEVRAKMEEIKKLDKNKYYQLLRSRFPFGVYTTGSPIALTEMAGLYNSGESLKKEKLLEIDVELLALKLKNSDGGSLQKIKSEMIEKLSELFEIKESQKQKEVERLEKRLQELKESLQYRKQNKNEIVQRRIQELIGDSRYLKWE